MKHNAETIKIDTIDAVIEEHKIKDKEKENGSKSSSVELASKQEECNNLIVECAVLQMK